MRVEEFLQRGYFPKELPPPFNTFSFGTEYAEIKQRWDNPDRFLSKSERESRMEFNTRIKKLKSDIKYNYSSSFLCKYSITKGKLSRRYVGIPNPLHYMKLAEQVVSAWDEIDDVMTASSFSQSRPVYQKDLYRRSLTTSCRGVSDFREKSLETSFDKKVELILDISRFYPSIYTHSVPWALLGKEKAKSVYNLSKYEREKKIASGDRDCVIYDKADKIDICIRNCQGKQTVGIPIGTDISFVVSELICSRIDICINEYNKDIVGCRYYDDYYLYVDTLSKAEDLLKFTQGLLDDFGLSINEEKIRLREFPFEFEDEFAIVLSKFDLSKITDTNLRIYFNLIWRFAETNPRKIGQIFRYGLQVFDPKRPLGVKIEGKEWKTFENLLYKTIMLDPSILNIAHRILNSHRLLLTTKSIEKLTRIACCIFRDHIPLKQDLEVSWALWLCKKFNLSIPESDEVAILRMENAISSLLLLDIVNSRGELASKPLLKEEIDRLADSFTEKSLFDGNWLLLYEGVLKGWIDREDLINGNYFFKILYDLGISFYDCEPRADYSSAEYILSIKKSADDTLKQKANNISEEIYEEVLDRKADEIKGIHEYEYCSNTSLEDIKNNLREQLDEDDFKNDILNSVLLSLMKDGDINKEEIITLYLGELDNYILSY